MLFAHQQHFQAFLKLHKPQGVEEGALGWGGRLSQPLSDSCPLRGTVDGVNSAGSVLKPGAGVRRRVLPPSEPHSGPSAPTQRSGRPWPALNLLPHSENLYLRATHLASALWLDRGVELGGGLGDREAEAAASPGGRTWWAGPAWGPARRPRLGQTRNFYRSADLQISVRCPPPGQAAQ